MAEAKALLLDVGDVIMRPDPVLIEMYHNSGGAAFVRRGQLDPMNDAPWRDFLAGRITAKDYWHGLAVEAGFETHPAMWRALAHHLGDAIFDPAAVALMDDARAAGIPLGILSNDMYNFSGREWVSAQPVLAGVDVLVDSTDPDVMVRKPAPLGYLVAAAKLGVSPSDVVFLDDTPECVDGANAVGMTGVLVQPLDRTPAFTLTRELLGLLPESRERRLVRIAEEVYQTNDLERLMALFHPAITIDWNGQRVANGLAEARQFHQQRLGFGPGGAVSARRDYTLRKTLRAASGDTITVEWVSTYTTPDGEHMTSRAGEFWRMRGDLLIEWHAYNHRWAS